MENKELNNEYKNNPFQVPDGYFEKFNSIVLEKIKNEEKPAFNIWKKTSLKIAASLVLIAGFSYLIFNNKDNDNLTFDSINDEELAQYENEIEISDDEFEELINEETIDSIYKIEFANNEVKNTEISETDIEELEEEYDPLEEDELEI